MEDEKLRLHHIRGKVHSLVAQKRVFYNCSNSRSLMPFAQSPILCGDSVEIDQSSRSISEKGESRTETPFGNFSRPAIPRTMARQKI
jgi:hypothetical protein